MRIDRINELIRQEVASHFAGVKDKHLGMITITSAETTPDLSQTKIWFTRLDEDQMTDQSILKAMSHYKRETQNHLNTKLYLKKVPKISFHIDHSTKKIERIEEIFEMIDEGKNIPL